MKRQLAIGIDDFRRIREEDYYYIDKTLLIKDFITYKKYVTLITRPRRFGKTLNMTMMREFFDISKDSKSIFKGLQIMNTGFAKQMNTIPVIYLTFKNCTGNTPEALKESLAKAVWEEYMRYARLFADSVDREDDRYYKFYLTYDKLREEAITDSILVSSLSRLMRAVYSFYEKRPIVLIDEYDHPLIKSYEKGFYDKFSDLYTSFLGEALKGNEFLGQALLTGIQRITKESIFSELNNFLVYTPLSKQYASYFGLQKNEVVKMLSYYEMKLTEEISSYYNGYIFGGEEIYNPWSLLSYIDEGTLKAYWRNTSTNALVRALIQDADHDFMEAFERLLINGEVKVAVNLEASLEEYISPRTLWGMFVNTGYLTIAKESTHGMCILKIPNFESKEEIRRMIASYTRLSIEKLSDLFIASVTNDVNAFVKIFQNLVYEYDGIYELNEDNYYMLFLGMAASVTGFYKILHYPQLGSTVSGFSLQSLHPDLRPSILIELRKGDDVEKLKQDALAEILAGQYYTGLEGKVLCVGLAHNESTCEVAIKRVLQAEAMNVNAEAPTADSVKLADPARITESTKGSEADKVVESDKVAESFIAAKSPKAAESAEMIEAAKAIEPAEVSESTKAEATPKTIVPIVPPKTGETEKTAEIVEAPKTGETTQVVAPSQTGEPAEGMKHTAATETTPAVTPTKTGEPIKGTEPTKAAKAAPKATPAKTVEPAKTVTPPKTAEPSTEVPEIPTGKTANVIELVAPLEPVAPTRQKPPTEDAPAAKLTSPSKAETQAKQAESAKVEPSAKQVEQAKAEPTAKQIEPAKVEPTAKQTEQTKAEPTAKQTEPAKVGPTAKQTEPAKAEPTKAEPSAKQVAPPTKQVAPTKAEPTTKQEKPPKKTKPPKAKKNKEQTATTTARQDDTRNNNNNINSNNNINNRKPQKRSFLNLIVTNLHIILAVIFLLGAIFFAVNNFRNNRARMDIGADAGYQVEIMMTVEQEDVMMAIAQEDVDGDTII